MQPDVFKAFLHFIYTDSIRHSMKRGLARGEKIEFTMQLLVAAHQYDVEKLKCECETFLCRCLHAENAATMFALADHHDCTRLRPACIEFITSPDNMAAVVASEGYSRLKDSCPGGLVDLFGLKERDM
jgi:speckle-type POZ protein